MGVGGGKWGYPPSPPRPPTTFVYLQGGSEKPKRPVSAMFIFSEEKRRQLQEERPELSESELTRLLARMWNDLSEKKKVGVLLACPPGSSCSASALACVGPSCAWARTPGLGAL